MIHGLFGLHGKFVVSLLVAAALPFFIGLIFFETIGYKYMVAERGEFHQVEAASLVASVTQASHAEGEKLRTWVASEPEMIAFLAQQGGELNGLTEQQIWDQIQGLDGIWESLPENDQDVMPKINNEAAESLRTYQAVHRQAVEMMLTDHHGRVVASTGKTSDYYQADELWWKRSSMLKRGEFWRDTIHFDDSCGVFVINIAMPIYQQSKFIGVIKMAVEVVELIPHLVMRGINTKASWFFVLRSGHVLISSDPTVDPMESRLPYEVISLIKGSEQGWLIGPDHKGDERIIGYMAMDAGYIEPNAYIVFSTFSDDLFDPLWANFIAYAMVGSSLLGLCLLAGFYIIQRKVLRPLSKIEMAVRSLSVLARMRRSKVTDKHKLLEQQHHVEDRLRSIQKIRTGDQMEVLAREIATMISRVLNYQYEFDKSEEEKAKRPAENEDPS